MKIFFLVALFSFTSAAKSSKNSTPLEDVTADNEIHQEDLEPQGSVLSYRLLPPASPAPNRRSRSSPGARLKAHLAKWRKKTAAKKQFRRPGIGQRRVDNGDVRQAQAMSATQEMRPLMAPPPILPSYQRAPHQKPLRRMEVGSRMQEPDREVITNINDADPGFLPPDMLNFIPDRQEMRLPGNSFSDFDGVSSRKFLNKKTKKEGKGGWATVKSLPPMPQHHPEPSSRQAESSYYPEATPYYPAPSQEMTDSERLLGEVNGVPGPQTLGHILSEDLELNEISDELSQEQQKKMAKLPPLPQLQPLFKDKMYNGLPSRAPMQDNTEEESSPSREKRYSPSDSWRYSPNDHGNIYDDNQHRDMYSFNEETQYPEEAYNTDRAYHMERAYRPNRESPYSPGNTFRSGNPGPYSSSFNSEGLYSQTTESGETIYSSEPFDEFPSSYGEIGDTGPRPSRSTMANPDPDAVERYLGQDRFSPTGSNPLRVFEGFLDSELLQQVGRVARQSSNFGQPADVEEDDFTEEPGERISSGIRAPGTSTRNNVEDFAEPIFYPRKFAEAAAAAADFPTSYDEFSSQQGHRLPKRGLNPSPSPYSATQSYTPTPKPFVQTTVSPYSPSPKPYVGSHTPGYPTPTTPSPYNSPIPDDYTPISYSAGDLSDFYSATSGPSFSPNRPSQYAPPGNLGPLAPGRSRHRRFKPYGDTTDYEPFRDDGRHYPENNFRPPIHVTDRRVEEQGDGENMDRVIFRGETNSLSGLANQIASHEEIWDTVGDLDGPNLWAPPTPGDLTGPLVANPVRGALANPIPPRLPSSQRPPNPPPPGITGPPGATNSYQVGVNHGQGGGTSYQKVTGFDDYGNKFEFENGVSHLRGH